MIFISKQIKDQQHNVFYLTGTHTSLYSVYPPITCSCCLRVCHSIGKNFLEFLWYPTLPLQRHNHTHIFIRIMEYCNVREPWKVFNPTSPAVQSWQESAGRIVLIYQMLKPYETQRSKMILPAASSVFLANHPSVLLLLLQIVKSSNTSYQ